MTTATAALETMIPLADLKFIIKDSIREALREERLNLYEILIPYVSKKEQAEIEAKFGHPARYDENAFDDMTDWVMK